jgi:hypothetical protein
MYSISLFLRERFNLKGAAACIFALVIVFSISACSGDKPGDAGKEKTATQGYGGSKAPAVEGEVLPEGHPTMTDEKLFTEMPNQDHTNLKSTKPVKVTEAIKAKYKSVNIQISDNSTGIKDVIKIDVGSKKALADGFSVRVDVFLPDYSIFDDYIASNSEELNNPAVMVELYKDDKVVASGWVFEEMAQYNSYSHIRYGVALMPTK